ncbi:MAG: putative photosynthetic complex assembly protein PuhE [Kiloniellaceae bacterium]
MAYAFPALFALFVWWFSTGVIIYLDGLPKQTFRWSMLGATLLFAGSLYGLAATSADDSVAGAYWAFTFGLTAWGWQEISFYMGYVTGPRKEVCPEGCRGWRHFLHPIQTSLWHELAIIASAAAVIAVTWNGANQVGTWTFMILWWMHQSAKLNVFLGVRNLNEEFLPEHLAFLKGFLTKRSMNLLFPVSITVSTVALTWLVQLAIAPGASAFEVAGFTFLATMMGLAVLEHWFLVVPLPSAVLWHWGLASRCKSAQPFEVEIASGFLGAGKTTFLRRRLAEGDRTQRTVALVNDFSELGVDASLLRGNGAEVVELPNGCICCSLRKDLAQQLQEVVARWAPQRIVIEPSGVADVTSLLRVLDQDDLRPLVKSLRLFTVIDASAFLGDYARLPGHFELQVRLAPVFVINKTDLISPIERQILYDTLHRLNPAAAIVPAVYGQIAAEDIARLTAGSAQRVLAPRGHPQPATGHEHPHEEAALGLQSWSTSLDGICDPQELHNLLEAIAGGAFGEVDRVKGIVQAGAGWVHFDVAGGRPSLAAFAPQEREQARVMAIGKAVDRPRLQAAFKACALPATAFGTTQLRASI